LTIDLLEVVDARQSTDEMVSNGVKDFVAQPIDKAIYATG
jgi:hypothetical protein